MTGNAGLSLPGRRGQVAVVDATHYGLEKPQLAMVGWFERLGLPVEFRSGRPERAA